MNARFLGVVFCALVGLGLAPRIAFGQTNVIYVNGANNTLVASKLSMRRLGDVLRASPTTPAPPSAGFCF